MKKLLSVLLALLMAAALLPMGSLAAKGNAEADVPVNPQSLVPAEPERDTKDVDENETVVFMVKLSDKPVAESVEEVNSRKAEALTGVLKNRQKRALEDIRALFPEGVECNVRFSYTLLFNGFAIEAPYYMMERIAAVPGVEKVFRGPVYSVPRLLEGEDTRLATSVGNINADDVWAAGYTGAGTKIAILDTGCVLAHNAFSTSPSVQSMTPGTLNATLANYDLHAEEKYDGSLTGDTLYYSGKIPFRFNYDNGSTNVAHSYAGSDHGSHVAGIVAGNYSGSNNTGVAKDAQLVIMEVFNQDTGAEWPVLLAAMEDCAYLEVDALNMSLGSDMGFTSEGEEIEHVYELLSEHGVNVAVAAGNSGSTTRQYYGSSYTYSLAMNPDNGVVSSPGTYFGSLCVASCGKSATPNVSTFTSWGTTADLRIKPEITAPGDSISAPVDSSLSGGTSSYGSKSGTSMATPHIAGAMGLLTGYVRDTWPGLSPAKQREMIDRLLMCTAKPLMSSANLPYSPRAQGSGEVDLLKAISTKAYVTVPGCDKPKLELGDDKDKTGVFTLSFNVVNFGSAPLTYSLTTYVESENAASTSLNGSTVYRMSITPMNIKANCTIGGDTTVTVPAGGTETVTVTIALNDTVKNTLDSMYPHGAYVEGFVVLDGDVDLSVPFLGFYGNWNEASVFDRYTYIDAVKGVNHFNIMAKQTVVGARNGSSAALFGVNPYITSSDWLAERATLSPNGDKYYDRIDNVVLALIRNAAVCGISIYNEDDPSVVYYDEQVPYMPKTWGYLNSSGGDSYYYYATDWMDFKSFDPSGLAEGTHLVFKMYAYLDNPDFTPEQNECCEMVLPMTVDNTAPVVTYWKIENNSLTVRFYDEHYAAWIGVYSDAACTNKIAEQAVAETERGAYTTLTLAIGSRSTVYVKLGDYGRNTSEVYELTGEGGSLTPVELAGIEVTPESSVVLAGGHTALGLARLPVEAVNFDVQWSSSNPAVATVTGGKSGAVVNGVARGTAVITATATDRSTGAVYTDSALVKVKNGYSYSYYAPTNTVEADTDYLIGFKNGSDVYLLMNYNPDPLSSGSYWGSSTNNYYFSYNSNYYGYGIKAVVDGEGNVTDVDTGTYPDAQLIHAVWQFIPNGSYYMIQSGYEQDHYLRVYNSSSYSDLYASTDTSYAVNWQWSEENSVLSYHVSSGVVKYVNYAPTAGSYQHFFHAPTSSSTVQLYAKVEHTVFEEEETYTVTFLDWDGTVLSVQEVEAGASAAAPEAPEREGYTFVGWDKDLSAVNEDMTVTALYTVNSYTLTVRYLFENGDEAAPAYTAEVEYGAAYSVASPVIPGYAADIALVEGVMGAGDAEYTVTYTSLAMPGDVDCNGEVTFADVSLLAQYLAGQAELSAQGMINADMNMDSEITFSDVSAIYQSLVG